MKFKIPLCMNTTFWLVILFILVIIFFSFFVKHGLLKKELKLKNDSGETEDIEKLEKDIETFDILWKVFLGILCVWFFLGLLFTSSGQFEWISFSSC